MSEMTNEPTEIQGAPVEPAQAAEPVEIDWKAKARDWEKRAKDNSAQIAQLKPLADQFRALEESTKSEAQRLAEAAEAAKRDAENYRTEAVRYKAAATHGIPADHFDLLGSGTEEEITARAERLAALIAAQNQPATPPPPLRRPVEQLRPGATPAGAESEQDVIYAQLFGK